MSLVTRALVVLWTVCCLLWAAGPAAAREKKREKKREKEIATAGLRFDLDVLNPEIRASLEGIDVLVLGEDNLELVWRLAEEPGLADVVVVACSPACHSSDVLEALADWARQGRGLFIASSAVYQASSFLLPGSFFVDSTHLELPQGRSWLAADSPLTENVHQVHHELWCSRDGTGSLEIRLPGPPEDWPEELLTGPGELLEAVLTWGRFRPDSPRALVRSRPILLASAYQGARVIWYAYDFDMETKCRPEYDDVRLWSNLMHWLAGR